MKLNLQDDRHCFACGSENPSGLKLSFDWDGSALSAPFTPLKVHQGYKDIVHGGVITTVLDECKAQAAIKKYGAMAATVEITVRFKKALRVGERAFAEARVEENRHGLIEGRATLVRISDGTLLAEASARMMRT